MYWRGICWCSTTVWVRSYQQEVVTACWAVKYTITKQAEFQSRASRGRCSLQMYCIQYQMQQCYTQLCNFIMFPDLYFLSFASKDITQYIYTSLLNPNSSAEGPQMYFHGSKMKWPVWDCGGRRLIPLITGTLWHLIMINIVGFFYNQFWLQTLNVHHTFPKRLHQSNDPRKWCVQGRKAEGMLALLFNMTENKWFCNPHPNFMILRHSWSSFRFMTEFAIL